MTPEIDYHDAEARPQKKTPAAHTLNHHMTTKMELHLKNKTSSQDLLACGNGGGLHDKLLLKSKGPKAGSSLQTERVPRSSVLDRLQNFLPRMAQANEKLKLLMEQAPEGHYDIERVEEEEDGKVIEMDVSLVELSSSDSDSDRVSSQDSDSNSDSEEESEVTEESLKLPGNNQRKKKKVNIQVLEKQED